MADALPTKPAPPPIVAIASWLVPGLGYLMIGEKKRGLTIGITVIALFIAGLLIGGVRVIEVPGYNPYGQRIIVGRPPTWIMKSNPWQEIKAKPWSIAQVMTGPVGILGGVASVWAAGPADITKQRPTSAVGGGRIAETSHTPVNEAGTLYTSVAGMLNLLAVIDAAYRAANGVRREEVA